MELTNQGWRLVTNSRAEIIELHWNQHNLLHDGLNWWNKIYPMIFPVVSHSRAYTFEKQNYQIAKHGFWNNLNWIASKNHLSHALSFGAVTQVTKDFPFAIAIYHQIQIKDQQLIITTDFANASQVQMAAFHFGHHPAFKIDQTSYLKVNALASQIAVQTGRYNPTTVVVNQVPLMTLAFGQSYDTLVFKKQQINQLTLVNQAYQIKFNFADFANIQLWKPAVAQFICIEPWQGTNDDEKNPVIADVLAKENIVRLAPQESRRFTFSFELSRN